MKPSVHPLFTSAPVVLYEVSVGACRGGENPDNTAGLNFYEDTSCKERCDSDQSCSGYVSGEEWCETYFSKGAIGDNRAGFQCHSKGLLFLLENQIFYSIMAHMPTAKRRNIVI